jgi:hypothetical protein
VKASGHSLEDEDFVVVAGDMLFQVNCGMPLFTTFYVRYSDPLLHIISKFKGRNM